MQPMERIAQLVIVPVVQARFPRRRAIRRLATAASGGFGSTGARLNRCGGARLRRREPTPGAAARTQVAVRAAAQARPRTRTAASAAATALQARGVAGAVAAAPAGRRRGAVQGACRARPRWPLAAARRLPGHRLGGVDDRHRRRRAPAPISRVHQRVVRAAEHHHVDAGRAQRRAVQSRRRASSAGEPASCVSMACARPGHGCRCTRDAGRRGRRAGAGTSRCAASPASPSRRRRRRMPPSRARDAAHRRLQPRLDADHRQQRHATARRLGRGHRRRGVAGDHQRVDALRPTSQRATRCERSATWSSLRSPYGAWPESAR